MQEEQQQQHQQKQQQQQQQQQKQQTLYDSIKSLRQGQTNKVYYRIILSGYLNQQTVKRQNINLQSYFKETFNGLQGSLTGYLYLKGVFYMHLLESQSMNDINNYLRRYSQAIERKKSLHNNTRVSYQSYQSPVRFFYSWDIDKIQQPGPVLIDTQKTQQQISDRTFQIYQFMEEGGKKRKQNHSFKISNMLLLSNDDMSLLISNFYMTLDEYCEIYLDEIESKKEAQDNYPLPANFFNVIEFMETDDYLKFKL